MEEYRKSKTLLQVQKCCLGIVDDIDRVCRKNGISYSLCGGSVIGAMVYGGYIPWDDDIDLMMTRENYDRFVRIYPAECDPRYKLHHYSTSGVRNLPSLFSRVEDSWTRTREEIAQGIRTGRVFVDITVFDQVPGKVVHRLIRLYAGYTYTFLYRMNGMIPGTGWKKALMKLLPGTVSERKLSSRYRRLENTCRWLSRCKGKYSAELLSAAFGDILYDSRVFDAYENIRFEDRSLMIVRNYRGYLMMRYGRADFPKDVPEEKRQKSHILKAKVLTPENAPEK